MTQEEHRPGLLVWRKARKITIVGLRLPLPYGSFVDGDSPRGQRAIAAFVRFMRLSEDPYWHASKEQDDKEH